MNKWLVAAIIVLSTTCVNAEQINHFTPGAGPSPGLISTTQLNSLVDVVNGLSGNGSLKVANGTVALPSIAFTSDTDTGIYRITTNNIGVAANGTKVLDIATTGLSVTSAGASAFSVGRLGATTPALVVDASTSTSITGIQIKSAATGGNVAITALGGTNESITIAAKGTGAVSLGSQLITTFGTPTIASGACGTTTNGAITSGTNQAGLITIGSATTTTCTVSFSATLTAAPGACVVFPHDAGGAATGTTVARVSSITTSQFVITGSALASTSYYYLCI